MNRPKATHHLEYGLLRGVAAVVGVLPYRLALGIGYGLAIGLYILARDRRREAMRRIGEVFGSGMSPTDVRRTAWLSCRNTIFGGVELLRLRRVTREWLRRVTECSDVLDALAVQRDSGRGAILAMPHMGSWEMAAATARLNGIPVFSIAAEQRNRLTSDFINRLRSASGMPVIMRGSGAMREVVRRLQAGEILAILPDLRLRTPGIEVPFLGGTANVADGMAALARAARVPIIPAYVTREGWTHHRFALLPPVESDRAVEKAQDVERVTREVFAQLDHVIREHPDQWFWYNRRWVLDPLETGPGGSPPQT